MKLNKLAALAIVALAMTACSDDNDYNTASDVSVEFESPVLKFSEDQASNTTFYNIPVIVNGEANGPITLTVDVTPGETAAVEDTHYVITSKNLVIPEGVTEVNIEFYPIGDNEINDDRTFNVSINQANGAIIGENAVCEVILVDNEGMIPRAYEAVQGTYLCTINSHFDGELTYEVEITGVEEGEEGYLSTLYATNMPAEQCVMEGKILVDAAAGIPMINFDFNQCVIAGNFNTSAGPAYLEGWPTYTNGSTGYYGTGKGSMIAYGNEDYSAFEMDFQGYPGVGVLLLKGGAPFSWWESLTSMTLERID